MKHARDPLADHMGVVARALLGEPNPRYSKPGHPRWGNKGSLSVDEERGVWFDHEHQQGGGVLDLIEREKGLKGRDAIEWMRTLGCRIDDEPAKPNGAASANGRHEARRSTVADATVGKRVGLDGKARKPDPHDGARREVLETYGYHGEDGTLLFETMRMIWRKPDGSLVAKDGKPAKTFMQRRPDPDDPKAWVWGLSSGEYMRKGAGENWYRFDQSRWDRLPAATRDRKTFAAIAKPVPYRLAGIVEAAAGRHPVLVVEGEQKADALAKWNLAATCNAEGAGKWTAAHARHLAGCDVIVLPDNDAAGRKHADAVVHSLEGIARRVRILDLATHWPKCPDKGDILDWIAAGGTREELDAMLELDRRPGPPSHGRALSLETSQASTYAMRGIRWFWKNRFALGKLGLIGGLPDRGKGLITSDMMARASRGDEWPCGEGRAIQGNVLLLTAEDDIEDTVIPRLVAAGADLERVHIVKMVHQGEGSRMFSLVTDLALLRQKIDAIGNVVLAVIDPISAYLGVGKVDAYRTTDVRGILAPLVTMAADSKLSIVGIMHFNKKADVHDAMLRIADSLAYVATARHCYVVVDDPENDRRLFIKAKNNLAPDTQALSYGVGVNPNVGHDPELGLDIAAPYVVWGTEHVNVTATEAMQAEAGAATTSRPGARDDAKKFLAEILAAGPMPMRDIQEAAEANCISEKTLRRAKADLGVVAKKESLQGGWMWQLDTQKPRWNPAEA